MSVKNTLQNKQLRRLERQAKKEQKLNRVAGHNYINMTGRKSWESTNPVTNK